MTSSVATAKRRRPLLTRGVVPVWLFTAGIGVAAAFVWTVDLETFGSAGGSWLPWAAIVLAAFYIAEAWPVHLHFRKQAHTLSLSEIGLVLGLFFATPAALLIGQTVGAGLALSVHRRQRALKFAFNVLQQSLCSGLALHVFFSLGGSDAPALRSWAAALAAAATAHVTGVLLVSAVIAVAERTLSAPHLGSTLGISLVGALATASLGLIAVELVENEPLALLLLILPAAACGLAFRGYMQQREQREHVEFLYESMRATQGAPELGLAVGQLLAAARRLLRAEYAEILLTTRTPGEPVLRSVSDAAGEVLMLPEALTPAAELAFAHVGLSDRALLLSNRREEHVLDTFLASRGLRDGVVGALRGDERVFGILIVGGRVGDVTTFDENDLTLFETFAGHSSVLLQNGRLEQSLAHVTELKEELRHQAYHDALTGLPNRLYFAEQITETLSHAPEDRTEHAVLFLDLDRFKMVNDSWGHAAGDELLVQVGQRIRHVVRPDDTPARLGGDEFAVLLRNTTAEGAVRAAQRLADAMEETFELSGREASVSASVGIALTARDVTTAEDLLRNADIAMYVAKADETRCFATYEPHLHSKLRLRQELGLELKRAIDRGEIVAHYQPVVSLTDGTIRAFEALARWEHPERGLIHSAEFIEIAEESGLIIDLGACVLEQALYTAREWHDIEHGVGLWVNLSPAEFANERLVEDLAQALTRARFDPRRLTVEITESSVMSSENNSVRSMHRLRDLGVGLAIDDFGTGYSSLSRLSELPIELLKIPKPFVDRLASDDADTSFVDAILRLAHSLGISAVAEGIEHLSQASRLAALGCGLGQGYLFSPALPDADAARLLRAKTTSAFLPRPIAV
jgi:diguanylate cyclase (GGDEF)-like protein